MQTIHVTSMLHFHACFESPLRHCKGTSYLEHERIISGMHDKKHTMEYSFLSLINQFGI